MSVLVWQAKCVEIGLPPEAIQAMMTKADEWNMQEVVSACKALKGLLDVRKKKTFAGKKLQKAKLHLHTKTSKAVTVKRGKQIMGVGGSVRAGIATAAAESDLAAAAKVAEGFH